MRRFLLTMAALLAVGTAMAQKPRPECYDVTWYLTGDLEHDVFDDSEIIITPDLKVEVIE